MTKLEQAARQALGALVRAEALYGQPNADIQTAIREALWADKCRAYKELMDATAKDADRAYELLRRAETEMRYAGWTKLESDNPARKDIYDDIKEFLK